ncbi:MAG: cbb3-type cytochrome c oxidase subunit I [Rhodospirillales bacterium]|nr:cbb3-type cytochrome c oxidase subunit I [Rhodospirillales bacterium]MCW8862434.1 cbb3-type cytochrome c oxidase subunit I [Rhodospirillales bacterium]MCW8951871.1 cbb3-type cytochrome c oxidase subunit I [Rhodospirillales bacterium]MCW8970452.1 cbb3-type cytochrome c oxidase subunit I [Rhodospirillales bacterium]MCW9003068.1 cbb3-type cytochrome c oxidase subunit I [Rhodospirillales bacterium]
MILEAYQKALGSSTARSELRGWALLAVAAIAIAGIYAVLMIVSRSPGAEKNFSWLLGFFHKGLVIHVVFSFVVWFLAVTGALLQLTAVRIAGGEPRLNGLGRVGLWLSVAAFPLLFGPAFLQSAEASLNNYVPVLIHPAYYAGLALLGAGIVLGVIRLFATVRAASGPLDTVSGNVVRAALVYLVALVCIAAAWWLQRHEAVSGGYNEDLFWGGGHVLQFVNTILLLVVWYILGSVAYGAPLVSDRAHNAAGWLLMLFALLTPAFYIVFGAFSDEQRQAFTDLQYALGPSALLVAVASLAGAAMRGRTSIPWRNPAFQCLFLSMGVFGLGGVFGFYVDGMDTRTPSHYHGMIGGVTLAYMGLFYAMILPVLGRPSAMRKTIAVQIMLYAFGQALQCVGLFMAGAPRKTAGAAQGLESAAEILGMRLNYMGGGLAILGGVLFVIVVGTALLKRPVTANEN